MQFLEPKPAGADGQERLAMCLQAASLVFTGWFIWTVMARAQWLHIPLKWLMLQSAIAAGAAWAASLAITVTLFALAMNWERGDVIRAALRTSAAAVWFAPAVILLSQLSPAALAGALMLVIYTTRLLYAQWRTIHPMVDTALAPPMQALFAAYELPRPLLLREMAPALTASVCVQAGVVATLLHYPLLAGIAYAMSAAVITVFALTSGAFHSDRSPSLPRSILGVFATILLAVGVTVSGLAPRLMHSFGWGEGVGQNHGLVETARAFLRELLYGEHPGPPTKLPDAPPGQQANEIPKEAPGGLGGDGFPGVILWPEVKPIPTLIAPLPPMGKGWSMPANMHPLSIPFSGEYWMFRWPYARPPKNSYFQRGNPAALSFSTTDQRPMQMEAHHKLEQAVDLGCCSRIQLAIRNADRYPGTVEVELVLLNSELPESGFQSLGKAMVASRPDTKKDPVQPVPETLDFPMPAAPSMESFNEFKIVFIRDRWRMDKSAKIAIDRFILVPR